MISCSWCGETYIDAPIYHVCPDGSSFTQRNARSPEDYTRERQRRARCASARTEMGSQKLLSASTHPDADPANIKWSTYDLKMMKKARIAP